MLKRLLNLLLTGILFLIFALTCSEEPAGNGEADDLPQGVVYVSTSGSDSYNGTKDSPVATLSKALEILLADNLLIYMIEDEKITEIREFIGDIEKHDAVWR